MRLSGYTCQVASQKITSSARKLEGWAAIRALDRVAMPLIRQGLGVSAAYKSALSGVALDVGEDENEVAESAG